MKTTSDGVITPDSTGPNRNASTRQFGVVPQDPPGFNHQSPVMQRFHQEK